MRRRCLVLVVCLGGALSGFSQEGAGEARGAADDPFARSEEQPAKTGATGIAFTAEWIEVNLDVLPGLLRKHGGSEDSSDLYAAVEALIETEEATRAEVVYGQLRDGSRTVIESVDEMIYPTDYDSPEIADKDEARDKAAGAKAGRSEPGQPTAFETRHVGTTVEVESAISADGQVIELNLVPETVTFRGKDYHVPEGDDSAPLLKLIWQPRFFTARIHTVVSVKSGSTTLLGSFKKPVALGEEEPERPRRLLLFIHVKTLSPAGKEVK